MTLRVPRHGGACRRRSGVRRPRPAGGVARGDRHPQRLVLVGRRPRRLGRDAQLAGTTEFSGRTLEEALAWCLVWLMAPKLGAGRFLPERPARVAIVTGV